MKDAVTRPSWHLREIDKVLYTAAHFGFLPIEAPKVTEKDREITADCLDSEPEKKGRHYFDPAEKAALLRMYMEKGLANEPHPLALAYKRAGQSYALHLLGLSTGLAEALLIRSALSILHEEGHENLIVDINCIGDKDSINAYERELHAYAKRAAAEIPEELKAHYKKDIFNLLKIAHPETNALRASAPSSVAYLTSPSRTYFKEVLEYIESLGVEFRFAPELVGNKHYCSHTIFAVKSIRDGVENTLALGYRYSRLSKRSGFKKEMPLASVTIYRDQKSEQDSKDKKYKELPRPKFYLIQLGREAKMKTLTILELLRENRIPVYHFLGKDKITAQLSGAEALRVPYLIIIGHKEALDGTATIRNMSTRAQDTIPMKDLPQFLKHLPI